MNLLERLFPKREVKVRILHRDSTALRLHEWRSDKALVATAAKVLLDGDVKVMLQVLQNEHPGNLVLRDDLPLDVRAMLQARGEGYTLALSNFRALAQHEPVPVDLVEDFAYTNPD